MKVDATSIKVKTTENPDVRQFSLDKKTLAKIIRSKPQTSKTKPYPIFSEVGNHLVCQIMEINGIKEICVEPKCLQIVKEVGTDWDNLENNICKAMENCFKK